MFFFHKSQPQKKKRHFIKKPLQASVSIAFCIILILSMLPQKIVEAQESSASSWPVGPELVSGGAILIEAGTGAVLFEKNSEDRFYPASTTKLMTALLAFENSALGEVVTVSHDAVYDIDVDSSRLWVNEGEELSMENSLYALMLPSANDLAYAIAEHISGTMPDFVDMMNRRAAALGCVNTHFENPHGLDADEHYSCPADLAKTMQALIKYPSFLKISGSKNYQIPATNLCKEPRWVLNTHLMIRGSYKYDGVAAGKTGHTDLAGANLVTYAKRGSLGLIAVIMKAPDDDTLYKETAALLDYGFNNFTTVNVERESVNLSGSFPLLFDKEDTVQYTNGNTLLTSDISYVVLPSSASISDITKQVSLSQLTSFSNGRNTIGKILYYYGSRIVGSTDIIYINRGEAFTLNEALLNKPENDPDTDPPNAATPTAAVSPDETTPVKQDRRPVIIGITLGSVCFFIGIYLLFVEIPYRRKRAAYLEKHRRK